MYATLKEPPCHDWKRAAIGMLGSPMPGHIPVFGKQAEDLVESWSLQETRDFVIGNGARLDVFDFETTDAIKEIILAKSAERLDKLKKQLMA